MEDVIGDTFFDPETGPLIKFRNVYLRKSSLDNEQVTIHLNKRIGEPSKYGQIFEATNNAPTTEWGSRRCIAKLEIFAGTRLKEIDKELNLYIEGASFLPSCFIPFVLGYECNCYTANGKETDAAVNVLIMERFDKTLGNLIDARSPEVPSLVAQLAACLASLNRVSGIYQQDQHSHNFMVKGSGPSLRFAVIDLGLAEKRNYQKVGPLDAFMFLVRTVSELPQRLSSADRELYLRLLRKYRVTKAVLQEEHRMDPRALSYFVPEASRRLGTDLSRL